LVVSFGGCVKTPARKTGAWSIKKKSKAKTHALQKAQSMRHSWEDKTSEGLERARWTVMSKKNGLKMKAATGASNNGNGHGKIGVLAIQGDYEAHGKMLERLGVHPVYVRNPEDLEGLRGLILPGGESTTHLKVAKEEGLIKGIKQLAQSGGAVFGTCAGAILMARDVRGPKQESLGLMDISVQRNGYGRQLASEVEFAPTALRDEPVEMVFIRAPVIESTGKNVKVLAEFEGHPVMVEQGNLMATTFHPELTDDTTIHERFLEKTRRPG
jgi:pyridoxal 5'-phosphate synthase pdxT subunit